ncbi:MAG TPA: TonB-dependent receptor [Planctomycetota bacterium]
MMAPSLFSSLVVLLCQDPAVATGLPPREVAETVVTASAFARDPLLEPFSLARIPAAAVGRARTLPEALQGQAGVAVQKTAYGQSSPYVRGFTGYRTLMLVDGVRLNHTAMRDGPNQYWSTVDAYGIDRLELVRGPASVLYGSDAIGGTVNAVARLAPRGPEGGGVGFGGALSGRWASAESSWSGRAELSVHDGAAWGLIGGITLRDFGDLRGGKDTGLQPGTGYRERAGDLRYERTLGDDVELVFAAQSMRQIDVPRTETTIYAKPFAGTVTGSERRREQDQVRDLVYTRLSWERGGSWFDAGEVTWSVQRHDEERDRLRTGRRRDLQGFALTDHALVARFQTEGLGYWSWGLEAHLQQLQSFRQDLVAGAPTSNAIQGPVGDDGRETTLAAYVQNEIDAGAWTLVPGVRATTIDSRAGRVVNPGPGKRILAVDNGTSAVVASLRALHELATDSVLFGGLSQGFRAPTLFDLTAFDSTSVVEVPTPGLDSERFLQAEAGWKGRTDQLRWQASLWRTWVQDMIVRSPTGALIGGTPVVAKSNSGDGFLHGAEVALDWDFAADWSVGAAAGLTDGEVDQLRPSGRKEIRAPADRLQPAQLALHLRWQPPDEPNWAQFEVLAVDGQDQLSLRDRADARRIPPGGTPGYTVFTVAVGTTLRQDVDAFVALENLGNADYRVHGSGVNGAGRSLVVGVELHF